MTRLDILKNRYDMVCHNLLCYSTSYAMDKPKQGCEKDWNDSAEECRILEAWLYELENEQVAKKNLSFSVPQIQKNLGEYEENYSCNDMPTWEQISKPKTTWQQLAESNIAWIHL